MARLIAQIYIGLGIFVVLASGWFLFNACTWVGRGVAIAGVIVAILPATLLARRFSQAHRTFWGWVSLVLGVVLIGIIGAIILAAPDGVASPDSPVRHRFTRTTRFQRYTLANIIPEWVWARFAEEHGYVIVAPSFGFGNWLRPGGVEAATRALDDAATVVELDPDRIYLAGISNGGLGVSRLAMASPEQFQGLIFLSPVMAAEIVDSTEFLDTWRGRPVLVITGEGDQRIPLKYVTRRVLNLQASGVEVTYLTYPDEDHFLFFSQPTSVLNDVSNWISN
jgi:hypothetical protein